LYEICGYKKGKTTIFSHSTFGVDPDPFKIPTKNLFYFFIFSSYYLLKVHLHHSSKIKSQKESQNSMYV